MTPDPLAPTRPSRSPIAVLRRAAPRVLWLLVLAVAARALWNGDHDLWIMPSVMFVFSFPWRPQWWRFVLTGMPSDEPGWLAERGTGAWRVILDAPGDRPIQVIKQIREATGIGLADARGLVDGKASVVVEGVSEEAAAECVRRLAAAGASARAVPA